MDFSRLVSYYERLEATTKRLEMRDILTELFAEAEPREASRIAYLTLGELYPAYVGVELGMAEKLAIRALKMVTGIDEGKIEESLRKTGDLGLVAEKLLSSKKTQMTLSLEPLTVERVYSQLERIAKFTGEGAMEMKVKTLSGLLAQASPKEAKYLIRLVTGNMRMGVADMTLIDALAALKGGGKEEIERAYNLCSDIGLVASTVKEHGVEGVAKIGLRVGIPVRPMLAERLTSAQEILEKLGNTGFAEYKYDGERMQIHKADSEVMIFSRRQENITSQFPDVVEMCRRGLAAREAIVECEAVAYDPETGDMLPFQELMHRRRKYDVEKAAQLYPVSLFFFDALYIDGEPLIDLPLLERRKRLSQVLESSDNFRLTEGIMVSDPDSLDRFMLKAVEEGCEGVMVKDISPKSIYRAGARGWLWIKYKRSYVSKLTDTLDLVVVGAFYGKGRRSGRIGTLLMAVYDDEADVFRTVCKVGTGFKDEDLEHLTQTLTPLAQKQKPARVESIMEPDIWTRPEMVLEIVGDEITLSPIHTCGWGAIRSDAGLAVRFPRFTGRYRSDKSPEDATTVNEIIELYKSQLKVIAGGGEGEPT
ncbi:MAG: ATP-dependent DNA ligase [Nitrososphaerota archaeon]